MLISYKRGQTSIILRVKILDSAASTGAGKTGLTSASAGLIISTIADNEATATAYTVTGSTIESITTLGTYAAPTATKCRFKEVDATNHKGVYEIQLADARFAVASAKSLLVSISGASGAAECDALIPLTDLDPYDAVRAGLTALPNAAAEAAGGLYTRGSGAGQINQAANGMIDTNPVRLNNVSQSLLDLKDFADDGYDPATNKVQGVVLTDTVTTYTGNTPQSGDNFARLGAPVGASISADIAGVQSDADNIQTRLPAALVSGRMDSSEGAIQAGVDFTATMKTSLNAATPSVTVSDKTGFSLSSAGVQAIWDALTSALTTIGSIGKLLVDNINATISSRLASASYTAPPSAAANASAVWDEPLAGHLGVGSTGAALNAAGSAGDPWSTALPGAYGAGTAGKIVGDNINATITSRASQASLDTLDDFVDTEVAAIKAKTDNLPAAPAAVSDVPTAAGNADALLGRNLAGGSNGGRMVKDALRIARNKVVISGTNITVYEEDDTAIAWTGVLTTNPAAEPITALDPA